MRIKNLFVLSFVLVALCANNARSIGDSVGKSADQLIDESNGIYVHDINKPENPAEARVLWNREQGLNFTTPNKLSGSGTSPEASRISTNADEGIQYQTASITNAAKTPQLEEVAVSQTTSVAGNWSFRLRDRRNRILALSLFQSDNVIFGTGTINDGGNTMAVSASGFVKEDMLSLDATSSGTVTLYKLVLTLNGNTASGEYRAYSNSEKPWIGLAEGVRIAFA